MASWKLKKPMTKRQKEKKINSDISWLVIEASFSKGRSAPIAIIFDDTGADDLLEVLRSTYNTQYPPKN